MANKFKLYPILLNLTSLSTNLSKKKKKLKSCQVSVSFSLAGFVWYGLLLFLITSGFLVGGHSLMFILGQGLEE